MHRDKTQIRETLNNGVGTLNKPTYRDGYLYEREVEPDIQQKNRSIRENNSAANGLIIGIGSTVLAGLLGVSVLFLTYSLIDSTKAGQNTSVTTNN